MKGVEAVVHGRVQRVMFRDFASRHACKLGLVGSVENLPDGTVRVVAEGKEEILEALLNFLRKGPLLAKVEKVDVVWREPSEAYTSFDIVYHSLKDRL